MKHFVVKTLICAFFFLQNVQGLEVGLPEEKPSERIELQEPDKRNL
jgi:hypothetical protein